MNFITLKRQPKGRRRDVLKHKINKWIDRSLKVTSLLTRQHQVLDTHFCRLPSIWWHRLDYGTFWSCDYCGTNWEVAKVVTESRYDVTHGTAVDIPQRTKREWQQIPYSASLHSGTHSSA